MAEGNFLSIPHITKIQMDRALIYVGKEMRRVLNWQSKEVLLGIAINNVLLLVKPEAAENLRESIDKVIKRLEQLKEKI